MVSRDLPNLPRYTPCIGCRGLGQHPSHRVNPRQTKPVNCFVCSRSHGSHGRLTVFMVELIRRKTPTHPESNPHSLHPNCDSRTIPTSGRIGYTFLAGSSVPGTRATTVPLTPIMDSGMTSHIFDDQLLSGIGDDMHNSVKLDPPMIILTAGRYLLYCT